MRYPDAMSNPSGFTRSSGVRLKQGSATSSRGKAAQARVAPPLGFDAAYQARTNAVGIGHIASETSVAGKEFRSSPDAEQPVLMRRRRSAGFAALGVKVMLREGDDIEDRRRSLGGLITPNSPRAILLHLIGRAYR